MSTKRLTDSTTAVPLAVCADSCFLHLPFIQRVAEITARGYSLEFWRKSAAEITALESAMQADERIRVVNFSGAFEGSIVHPDGVGVFLAGVEARLPIARRLGCKTMMLVTGELSPTGAAIHAIAGDPASQWITAYRALSEIADIAEKHHVAYNLENLNSAVDHPGYPLCRVEDVAELLDKVGSERVRLLLDLYHARMQGDDPVKAILDFAPLVGHIHVADAPGRHEPGTGVIDWAAVTSALAQTGYSGVVGLEAFPAVSDDEALRQFAAVFAGPGE